jgi:hypothetical protein
MEESLEYFKDILDKMIMLDYDIFRISLLMYQNFDFKDYKESFVKITKMIYNFFNFVPFYYYKIFTLRYLIFILF